LGFGQRSYPDPVIQQSFSRVLRHICIDNPEVLPAPFK